MQQYHDILFLSALKAMHLSWVFNQYIDELANAATSFPDD
ncbi:hypothetical protein EAPG_01144 [Escherichia albertii B156]|nr:hypothetical protein EAPG_01144 [Escherichia albertii B156]